jgi:threonine dehydratase
VLVGMQIPNGDRSHVEEHFDAIGYRYWKESDNPAYQLFMA